MTKDELIKYYENELDSLTKEIEHHKGREAHLLVEFCRGQRIMVRSFIEDLKNLPNELKGVSNNEQKEKFCANYENTIHTDTDLCDNCGERKGKH